MVKAVAPPSSLPMSGKVGMAATSSTAACMLDDMSSCIWLPVNMAGSPAKLSMVVLLCSASRSSGSPWWSYSPRSISTTGSGSTGCGRLGRPPQVRLSVFPRPPTGTLQRGFVATRQWHGGARLLEVPGSPPTLASPGCRRPMAALRICVTAVETPLVVVRASLAPAASASTSAGRARLSPPCLLPLLAGDVGSKASPRLSKRSAPSTRRFSSSAHNWSLFHLVSPVSPPTLAASSRCTARCACRPACCSISGVMCGGVGSSSWTPPVSTMRRVCAMSVPMSAGDRVGGTGALVSMLRLARWVPPTFFSFLSFVVTLLPPRSRSSGRR